jgi:hypothetical protein
LWLQLLIIADQCGRSAIDDINIGAMANNTSNRQFSPKAKAVVDLAEHLALTSNSLFTGTEHLLQALLDSPCRSVSWLERQGMSKEQVLTTLNEILAVTKGSGEASFYSTSLARSLQLAAHIWQGYPIPTEGLLMGAFLASKENTNAFGALLGDACGGKDLLELLLVEQPFAISKLDNLPPKEYSISLTWGDPVTSPHPLPSRDPLPSQIEPGSQPAPTPGTHWVIPGHLAAGKSAGGFSPTSLIALVNAGVDTFVSLQESYYEYGCTDYRQTLRNLAKKPDFPPHPINFLHFPIPDFGVVEDEDMLALTNQLVDLLRNRRSLYVHCYGGHGRTGTVLLHLLSAILGKDMQASMEVLRTAHKARGCRHCSLKRGELEDRRQQRQADRLEKIVYTRDGKIKKFQENKY